jgi:VanZ family protein
VNSRRRRRKLIGLKISQVFFLVGVLLVVYFSLYAEAVRFQVLGGDKLWHVLAFGFLGLTGAIVCPSGYRLLMAFAGLVVFGLMIEMVQFIMPGRSAHLSDFIANFVGLSCGFVLAVGAKFWSIRRSDKAS